MNAWRRTISIGFAFFLLFLWSTLTTEGAGFPIYDSRQGEKLKAPLLIENPAKPTSKNAGRVIKLQSIYSIKDQPDKFFFRWPMEIKASLDDQVFVLDRDQILHFDSSGQFLRNYFRQGQGPGEMLAASNIALDGENLVTYDPYARKICRFNFSGELVNEFKINEAQIGTILIYAAGSKYYFFRAGFPNTDGKWIKVNNPNILQVYDEKERRLEELATFAVPAWAISSAGGRGVIQTTQLRAIPYQRQYFIIYHTEEYLLKIFNVEKKKVISAFRRKYHRIRAKERREAAVTIGIGGQDYTYTPTHYNDVLQLLVNGNLIWAITSTVEKNKGILVDVFNEEGQYIDCFYLKFPFEVNPEETTFWTNLALSPDGSSLWAMAKNPDESHSLQKLLLIR